MTAPSTTGLAVHPTSFVVVSETDPSRTYHVQLPDCDCADFRYRRVNRPEDPFCKHLQRAFAFAGWQIPEQTQDLDAEGMRALLVRHGLDVPGANQVMRNVRSRHSATVQLPAGPALVSFAEDADGPVYTRFGIDLPA